MNRERLPNDLAEYIRQKYTRFAIKCAVWDAAVLIMEVSFLYRRAVSLRGHGFAVTLAVVLLVLPFIIFGGIKMLFDRSWEGKVILLEVKNARRSGSPKFSGVGRAQGRLVSRVGRGYISYYSCEIYVETDDGKTYTYLHEVGNPEKLIYKVGDRVKKVKGLPHPVNVTSKERECAVCGGLNPMDSHECGFCGYSLIE